MAAVVTSGSHPCRTLEHLFRSVEEGLELQDQCLHLAQIGTEFIHYGSESLELAFLLSGHDLAGTEQVIASLHEPAGCDLVK
ncbi:hypothetical protein [Sphingobium quisquiliarum]|uniref:hypothetical protein n=1 Tax=Sphingobium quisquiliarum TaxID=538379 RepID=UPI001377D655|nr:hypothetical protein [Sphingobium quisquiliarum]